MNLSESSRPRLRHGGNAAVWLSSAFLFLFGVGGATNDTGSWITGEADPKKTALIIAISAYGTPVHPMTGVPLRPYRPLNAKNDVPLVVGALSQQGFEASNMRVLTDSDADAEGIRDGLRWLVDHSAPGDVVVFHYSGHGHRITNDDPDEDEEVDGYDEVLAPYGAPDEFYDGYDGRHHIRDDELGEFLGALRTKVGEEGSVTFFLDACFSGTGTRGELSLPVRGSQDPLGLPNPATASSDAEARAIDVSTGPSTRGGRNALAPFAVFSAAGQRELAYETTDVDGETRVGSLSYALARTLPTAGTGTTNLALFARIADALSGKVPQTPQMEGVADAHVFSNRLVRQRPFIVVDSVLAESSDVALAGGTLLGLNPGTKLEVFPMGASDPVLGTGVATLEVTSSDPIRALATVAGGSMSPGDDGMWAFVTDWTFGEMETRVLLSPGMPAGDRAAIAEELDALGVIRVVDELPDVIVTSDENGELSAYLAADGTVLSRGGEGLAATIERFSRGQYLRKINLDSQDLSVSLDLLPVDTYTDSSGSTQCRSTDWTEPVDELESVRRRMSPGDTYRVRVSNPGRRSTYIALLDIMPRGAINVLRPREHEAPGSYRLQQGESVELGCYAVDDELGHETLKVFATTVPQDFRRMFSARSLAARGALGALGALVSGPTMNTRSSEIGVPDGMATTTAIHIEIVPR